MKRQFAIATAVVFAAGLLAASVTTSDAQVAATSGAQASSRRMTAEEFSAQSTRILRRRVPVYRRALGPNAVRVCNARYVQEYRESGTVIVPRMNCYWQQG